jgi:uncharacterized membrane protein YjjP (DUF1212 family)
MHPPDTSHLVHRTPETLPDGRPSLDREALSQIVELALWGGQLLMENGAETQRVEESVRSMGLGLGCDWGNVVVTHGAIIVTYVGGGDFRTKIRSVRAGGIDMSLLEAMSHLCHRINEGKLTLAAVRAELERIQGTRRAYGEWQTNLAAGLGCAAFCRLFEGDWPALGGTLVASSLAMFLRSNCARRGYSPVLTAGVTALVAASIVGLLNRASHASQTPAAALAASVILLVPGPAAINAVEDLIKGHILVGLARATFAGLILVFATLGLLAAMRLTAVPL